MVDSIAKMEDRIVGVVVCRLASYWNTSVNEPTMRGDLWKSCTDNGRVLWAGKESLVGLWLGRKTWAPMISGT